MGGREGKLDISDGVSQKLQARTCDMRPARRSANPEKTLTEATKRGDPSPLKMLVCSATYCCCHVPHPASGLRGEGGVVRG